MNGNQHGVGDHPNDLLNPTDNNPNPSGYPGNYPGHPDCLH